MTDMSRTSSINNETDKTQDTLLGPLSERNVSTSPLAENVLPYYMPPDKLTTFKVEAARAPGLAGIRQLTS